MGAALCDSTRDTKEGVKGVDSRMKECEFVLFFFHNLYSLCHFLDHQIDTVADDFLDIVL